MGVAREEVAQVLADVRRDQKFGEIRDRLHSHGQGEPSWLLGSMDLLLTWKEKCQNH